MSTELSPSIPDATVTLSESRGAPADDHVRGQSPGFAGVNSGDGAYRAVAPPIGL